MNVNPPAEGFDLENSDPKAIAIADKVMDAMGGRAKWDETRYIGWKFFGRRKHIWDKWTGNARIEYNDSNRVVFNINTMEGKIMINGEESTSPDSLTKYLDRAKRAWINDSYWLVMPFKLKDSGVTLSYVGEDTTQAGDAADVLSLTFKEVGVTPQNKYHIYVDKADHLVSQWAFFSSAEDAEPRIVNPWSEYRIYNDQIMLSGDRGRGKMEDIQVWSELPESVFNSLEAVEL